VVASGDVGRNLFTTNRTLTLYTAAALTFVVGLGVRRRRDARAGVALGVLAGIAYAGSPVATRSLVDPRLDAETIAPAITIGLFGLLGFWLYSMAMRRTSVTAATAPLVLLETVVPAVVGVLVFGDGVRAGLWPVAAVGLTMSVAGALVLCGAESRLEHLEHHPHAPAGTAVGG
jgi:drug/metabolite transporter (DMT)-like permease